MIDLSNLHVRIHKSIRERKLVARGQKVLLAISGGQDSMCMLHILKDLTPLWHWQLRVMHCNHRWTPAETDCAEFVRSQAHHLGIPYHVATANTIYLDENRARQWRYQQLMNCANAHQCDVIATAHTGSDRAETFLFNLMRGSGITGLSSLKWSRPIQPLATVEPELDHPHPATQEPQDARDEPILAHSNSDHETKSLSLIRPLLGVWRQETADYCQDHTIPIWEDPFNQDFSHPVIAFA